MGAECVGAECVGAECVGAVRVREAGDRLPVPSPSCAGGGRLGTAWIGLAQAAWGVAGGGRAVRAGGAELLQGGGDPRCAPGERAAGTGRPAAGAVSAAVRAEAGLARGPGGGEGKPTRGGAGGALFTHSRAAFDDKGAGRRRLSGWHLSQGSQTAARHLPEEGAAGPVRSRNLLPVPARR